MVRSMRNILGCEVNDTVCSIQGMAATLPPNLKEGKDPRFKDEVYVEQQSASNDYDVFYNDYYCID